MIVRQAGVDTVKRQHRHVVRFRQRLLPQVSGSLLHERQVCTRQVTVIEKEDDVPRSRYRRFVGSRGDIVCVSAFGGTLPAIGPFALIRCALDYVESDDVSGLSLILDCEVRPAKSREGLSPLVQNDNRYEQGIHVDLKAKLIVVWSHR